MLVRIALVLAALPVGATNSLRAGPDLENLPRTEAAVFDCSQAGANCAGRLGATHWSPCYFMDASVPSLIDGARQVASMGSRVIKVAAMEPRKNYPWNSPAWPEDASVASLLDIVQHEYYRQLWDMDFDTFVLVAYSTAGGADLQYWHRGITSEQEEEESVQFNAAAAWLLQHYPSKEFIFENWEGDWASRGNFNRSEPATDLALTSMTKWLAARQKGVTEARAAHRQAGAKGNVFFAAEVNLVVASLRDGQPNMVNRVLPNVALDMVSYSSYDSQSDYTDFKESLQYLQRQHKRTDDAPSGFGAVFVAEYGVPQMKKTQAQVEATVRNVVNTALGLGVRHVLYWETFCNECTDESDPGCSNGHCTDPAHPVTDETKLMGFWLIRPNGTSSWPRDYLASKIGAGTLV